MMRSGAFAFLGLFDTPFVCAVGLEAGLAGDDRADRRAVICVPSSDAVPRSLTRFVKCAEVSFRPWVLQ